MVSGWGWWAEWGTLSLGCWALSRRLAWRLCKQLFLFPFKWRTWFQRLHCLEVAEDRNSQLSVCSLYFPLTRRVRRKEKTVPWKKDLPPRPSASLSPQRQMSFLWIPDVGIQKGASGSVVEAVVTLVPTGHPGTPGRTGSAPQATCGVCKASECPSWRQKVESFSISVTLWFLVPPRIQVQVLGL